MFIENQKYQGKGMEEGEEKEKAQIFVPCVLHVKDHWMEDLVMIHGIICGRNGM